MNNANSVKPSQSLPLPAPDFDSLKNALRDHLRNQDALKDYDFDGSIMSTVLDVLSYNSYMNTFWLNMVANEAFLHTAIKRNNVVSAARNLNYIPRSASCAYTDLYIEYMPNDIVVPENSITIPSGTIFSAQSESSGYTFNLLDDVVAEFDADKGIYVADDVRVFEGKLLFHEYSITSRKNLTDINSTDDPVIEGLSIRNVNVDSESITVLVKDNSISNDWVLFSRYDDGLDVDENSRIFFLSEDEFGYQKVTFGDGTIGVKPSPGSKVKIVYLISSGPGANGVAYFNQASSIPGVSIKRIVPKYPAGGGSFGESLDSIKYNAQLGYEAQGRAVVASDYEYMAKLAYPNAKAVLAWGGQDNDPPMYGKVFISVQPNDGLVVTDSEKAAIKAFIKKKNVITIEPEILEPDYTFVDTSTQLYYDKTQAKLTGGALERAVKDKIKQYSKDKLSTYFKNLEFSKLLAEIDSVDSGIITNITDIKLNKRLYVRNNKLSTTSVSYHSSIKKGTITSTPFAYGSFKNCYFAEYGDNKLAIQTTISGNKTIIVTDAGSINYDKGIIELANLEYEPDKLFYNNINHLYYIKLFAEPNLNSLKAKSNNVLVIENSSVKASMI